MLATPQLRTSCLDACSCTRQPRVPSATSDFVTADQNALHVDTLKTLSLSKVLCVVALFSKFARALIFQSFYQVAKKLRQPDGGWGIREKEGDTYSWLKSH